MKHACTVVGPGPMKNVARKYYNGHLVHLLDLFDTLPAHGHLFWISFRFAHKDSEGGVLGAGGHLIESRSPCGTISIWEGGSRPKSSKAYIACIEISGLPFESLLAHSWHPAHSVTILLCGLHTNKLFQFKILFGPRQAENEQRKAQKSTFSTQKDDALIGLKIINKKQKYVSIEKLVVTITIIGFPQWNIQVFEGFTNKKLDPQIWGRFG